MRFFQKWLSAQLELGSFHSRKAVYGFALKMTFKAVILAFLFNLVALPVFYLVGLLPVSLLDAFKLSVVFAWLLGGAVSGALALVTGNAIRELSLSRSRYERRSRTDVLSGLLNRRAFSEVLNDIEGDASLAILDLDRFKAVNDCHGHRAGDTVIRAVSSIIREVFPHPHVCARLGGEEFGVIIRGGETRDRQALVEEVRNRIANQPTCCDEAVIETSISVGIAEFGRDRHHESVYSAADRALYIAKAAGRNRVVHEDQGIQSLSSSAGRPVADDVAHAPRRDAAAG